MDIPTKELPQEPTLKRSYKRLWCAVLSAAVPGLGDWPLGNKKRSLILLALFVAILFSYWPLRLPSRFPALLALLIASPALNIASACLAFLSKRNSSDAPANWWALVLVPVAIFCAASEIQVAFRISGFRVYDIPASSMSPTIEIGDAIVVDQHYLRGRKPGRGDVVVFRHRDLFLVKRIIALGGDTISSVDGQVSVNGSPLQEPYAVHRTPQFTQPEQNNFGPVKVPEGEVFVAGDNRDESLDSRIRSGEYDYGPVYASDLIGKPLYVFKSTASPSRSGKPIR
jgi:signal peptidase I